MQATRSPRRTTFEQFVRDSSPSTLLSGLVTVLIAFSGPTVLIYAVARAAHLPESAVLSWVWASTVLCGLVGLVLSLRTRLPIVSTWSTPGIAFLVTALPGIPFAEAVGAFVVSGVLVAALGSVRVLTRTIERLPEHLAGALNAAILLPFCFRAVQALGAEPLLVGAMIAVFLGVRRVAPAWAVAGVLLVGIAGSTALGLLQPASSPLLLAPTVPAVVWPQFTWSATLNLALPLTVLAFTGQFIPGLAVLRAAGYRPDPGPIVRACGTASVVAAFAGCHNLTLGALIANVTSGPDAHPDPARRYTAAVWAGLFFVLFGLFSGTFLHVMALLPAEALHALAGLALLGAATSALQAAFRTATGSLAAPTVLVVTLAGVTFLGLGAAFWGIVAGLAVHAVERARRRDRREDEPAATR